MKGRKPTPTALKILMGNPGKRPLPEGEPMPDNTMPEPPSHLDEYALMEWRKRAPALHVIGVLSFVDAGPFAAYCAAFAMWRKAAEELQRQKETGGPMGELSVDGRVNPLIKIGRDAAADVVKFAAEFGMTPSARVRLAIDTKSKPKSKFDGLLGGRNGL